MLKLLLIAAVLLVCSQAQKRVTAVDDDDTNTAAKDWDPLPCSKELEVLCKIDYAVGFERNYESRMCLRAFRDMVSDQCRAFLEVVPSIVEPCFQEINTYCIDVEPGDNRILSCLVQQDYASISHDCQIALSEFDWAAGLEIVSADDDSLVLTDDQEYNSELTDSIATGIASLLSVQYVQIPAFVNVSASELLERLIEHIAAEMSEVEQWIGDCIASTWTLSKSNDADGNSVEQWERNQSVDIVDCDVSSQLKKHLRGTI